MMREWGRMWVIVGVVVATALMVGAAGALPVRSQSERPDPATTIQSTVGETIGYQGFLTDSEGEPLSGTYAMEFALYRVETFGTPVFQSGEIGVAVSEGLFEVGLAVPQQIFDGGPLWLAIVVDGEVLSPRQQIRPAPYAMSLRPGATVALPATGTALQVTSADGVGLQGTGRVYGVHGTASGATQGSGYGGYFESDTGIGVLGRSTALSSHNNLFAPGVAGYSEQGVGVLGQAATGFAVYGTSPGVGVGGSGQVYGVYGESAAQTQGAGYGGYFASSTGIGVFGESTALTSLNNNYAPGVYGRSERGAGVLGEAGGPGSVAGLFLGHVVIEGDLFATGSKAGYVVDIARNDGDKPLVRGHLVVVTGAADPVLGDIPVPLVRKADTAASTAVIGVVDAPYGRGEDGVGRGENGPIAPGEYLTIVTLGTFGAINVDASYGAIQPGDLLVSSPTPGHAMRTEAPDVGTVVGKALGTMEDGTGSIAVMVTLQ